MVARMKRKRKGGRGKAKGSSFERMICKSLSLWVSQGKSEDLFWRSAMSGGRATLAAAKGKNLSRQAGDISAIAPAGHKLTDHYYVECKHYKNLALDSFCFKGTGLLAKFWLKTCKEALRYGKCPMLIAKQNNMPTLVITEDHSADYLQMFDGYYVWVRTAKYQCAMIDFAYMVKGKFV